MWDREPRVVVVSKASQDTDPLWDGVEVRFLDARATMMEALSN
jgi:hypothetical protein